MSFLSVVEKEKSERERWGVLADQVKGAGS